MPSYKESTITGTTYTRAREVTVRNPHDGDKGICFAEERVTVFGADQSLGEFVGAINEPFTSANAGTTFPLLDSETGLPTGATAAYSDVYQILFSLYYNLAAKRDAAALLVTP